MLRSLCFVIDAESKQNEQSWAWSPEQGSQASTCSLCCICREHLPRPFMVLSIVCIRNEF